MKNPEIEITNLVNQYVEGYLNANASIIEKVFHADTVLNSVHEDRLSQTSMSDWLDNLKSRHEKQDFRNATKEIQQIDVTEKTAFVKLAMTFSEYKFTDYLSLLNVENNWVIVGKIYDVAKLTAK